MDLRPMEIWVRTLLFCFCLFPNPQSTPRTKSLSSHAMPFRSTDLPTPPSEINAVIQQLENRHQVVQEINRRNNNATLPVKYPHTGDVYHCCAGDKCGMPTEIIGLRKGAGRTRPMYWCGICSGYLHGAVCGSLVNEETHEMKCNNCSTLSYDNTTTTTSNDNPPSTPSPKKRKTQPSPSQCDDLWLPTPESSPDSSTSSARGSDVSHSDVPHSDVPQGTPPRILNFVTQQSNVDTQDLTNISTTQDNTSPLSITTQNSPSTENSNSQDSTATPPLEPTTNTTTIDSTGNATGNTSDNTPNTGNTPDNTSNTSPDDLSDDLYQQMKQRTKLDRQGLSRGGTTKEYESKYADYVSFCSVIYNETSTDPSKIITVQRVYEWLFYHAHRPLESNTKGSQPGPFSQRPPKKFSKEKYDKVVAEALKPGGHLEYHVDRLKSLDVWFSAVLDKAEDPILITALKNDKNICRLKQNQRPKKRKAQILEHQETFVDEHIMFDMESITGKLEKYFWDHNKRSKSYGKISSSFRNRFCMLDSLQTLVRGEALFSSRLCDQYVIEHKAPDEPEPYFLMFQSLHFGKCNSAEKGITLTKKALRHKNPERCAHGAKAFYLWTRFEATKEEFDFTNNDWFDILDVVAVGNNAKEFDNKKQMSTNEYYKQLTAAYEFIGVHLRKVCHIGRYGGTCILELGEVDPEFKRLLGQWALDVMETHYSHKLPFQAIRVAAGFRKEQGSYYVPRSKIPPPQSLVDRVFPNITKHRPYLDSIMRDSPHMREKCHSAIRFVKSMEYFAKVILQDAAWFITHGRGDHFIFQNSLFKNLEFQNYVREFSEQLHHLELPENDPTHNKVEKVLPDLHNMWAVSVSQINSVSSNQYKTLCLQRKMMEDSQQVIKTIDKLARDNSAQHGENRKLIKKTFRDLGKGMINVGGGILQVGGGIVKVGASIANSVNDNNEQQQGSDPSSLQSDEEDGGTPDKHVTEHSTMVTPSPNSQSLPTILTRHTCPSRFPPPDKEYASLRKMRDHWLGSPESPYTGCHGLRTICDQRLYRNVVKEAKRQKNLQRLRQVNRAIDDYEKNLQNSEDGFPDWEEFFFELCKTKAKRFSGTVSLALAAEAANQFLKGRKNSEK